MKLDAHMLTAHYNDARHNVFLCMQRVMSEKGRKPLVNDDQIEWALGTLNLPDTAAEEYESLHRIFRHHFNFLVAADNNRVTEGKSKGRSEKDDETLEMDYDNRLSDKLSVQSPESLLKLLLPCFQLITMIRNEVTHPIDKHDHDGKLGDLDRKHLIGRLSVVYAKALDAALVRLNKSRAIKHKYALLMKKKGVKDTVENDKCPFLFAGKAENPTKATDVFTDFGLVFFCSLFLEPRQSGALYRHYCERHECGGIDQEVGAKLLTVHRVRLPLIRLYPEDNRVQVALDTLSEITRCPRSVFSALSPKDQAPFRVKEGLEDDGDDLGQWNYVRGHSDRFDELLMRQLDDDSDFNLRFAVDLGYYHFDVRQKAKSEYPDSIGRMRRIGQRLIGYGRLNHFEIWKSPIRGRC